MSVHYVMKRLDPPTDEPRYLAKDPDTGHLGEVDNPWHANDALHDLKCRGERYIVPVYNLTFGVPGDERVVDVRTSGHRHIYTAVCLCDEVSDAASAKAIVTLAVGLELSKVVAYMEKHGLTLAADAVRARLHDDELAQKGSWHTWHTLSKSGPT